MSKKKKLYFGFILFVFIILFFGILIYKKILLLNNPSEKAYPIRGVDVSHYQGDIDWNKLSIENIDFAFIKATEGSSSIDDKFDYNWKKASETNLKIGAYHFFSYDSLGETQAENFIKTVDKIPDMLPPVVDIEFYGDKEKNLPEVASTRKELQVLLDTLEAYYGVKPIIYATMKSYHLYIGDSFEDYPLWIRNVYYSPNIDLNGKWTFWQYTDRNILEGYEGSEKYIDMNVFCGSMEDLENFLIHFK